VYSYEKDYEVYYPIGAYPCEDTYFHLLLNGVRTGFSAVMKSSLSLDYRTPLWKSEVEKYEQEVVQPFVNKLNGVQ
jgi:hypothetical protein